jgi:ATP-dependent protease ClpP protease subunit
MIVDITGEFGNEITIEGVRSQLQQAGGKPITVRFYSEGGSVLEGYAIRNALKEYPGAKTAIVDAAFSIASYVVAASGFDRILQSANGWQMLHNPYCESDELKPGEERFLGSLERQIAEAYAERARKPVATIEALMEAETFLSASEAVRWGFADYIVDNSPSMQLAAKLRDKVQARLVNKSAIEQWKNLCRVHGASKANRLNPALRMQVLKEAN